MPADAANWRLMSLGAVLGIFGPHGYEAVRQSLFDARQYYTYQSTEGPFAAALVNGGLIAENPLRSAKPGEWIAWRSVICFAADVAVTADTTLRAVPNGKPMQVSHHKIPANTQCGPLVEGLQLPENIPDGDYVIERVLRIESIDAPSVSTAVPGVAFRVAR